MAWGACICLLYILILFKTSVYWPGYIIYLLLCSLSAYLHYLTLLKFVLNEMVSARFVHWVINDQIELLIAERYEDLHANEDQGS